MLCARFIIEFGPHRCNWQLSALNKGVEGCAVGSVEGGIRGLMLPILICMLWHGEMVARWQAAGGIRQNENEILIKI